MAGTRLPALRVHLLGGPRATVRGRSVTIPKKAKPLLAYELLHPARPRDDVAEAIDPGRWGSAPEEARADLYRAANELRAALGGEWVPPYSSQILADRPWVDTDHLAAMPDEQAVVYCEEHGDLLKDLAASGLGWVAEARAEHHEKLMHRLRRLIGAYRREGRSADIEALLVTASKRLPEDQFERVAAAARGEPLVSPTAPAAGWPHYTGCLMAEVQQARIRLEAAEKQDQPPPADATWVTDILEGVLSELQQAACDGRFYEGDIVGAVAGLLGRAEGHEIAGASGCRLQLALVRDAYGGYREALADLAPLLNAPTPSLEVIYLAGIINMNFGRLDVAKQHLDSAVDLDADPLKRLRAREVRDLWLPAYRGEHQKVLDAGTQLLKDSDCLELPSSARSGIVWRMGIAWSALGDKQRAYRLITQADHAAGDPRNPHRPRVIAQVAREAGDRATYEREWQHFHEILESSTGLGLWAHYRLAEAHRRTENDPYSSKPKLDLSCALADANEALNEWRRTGYLDGYCKALLQRGAIHGKHDSKAAATDYGTAQLLAGRTQLAVRHQANRLWSSAGSERDRAGLERVAEEQAEAVSNSFFD
jgi:tetratricopeptide (TPR) repeat protein